MAKKTTTGLSDVFAKPGQAPARNTPIEDLPRTPASPAAAPVETAAPPVAPASSAPAPAETAPTAVPQPVAEMPTPAAAPVSGPVPSAAVAPLADRSPGQPAAAKPAPAPVRPAPALPPSAPATAPARRADSARGDGRGTTLLAVAAIVVAIAAPLLDGPVLKMFGVATPTVRAQEEIALTISRQEQKLRDLDERLTSIFNQLAATRADLQQATRRAGDDAAWGRLLSLGRLADALRGSAPFASDLAVAQAIGGLQDFRADLTALGGYAVTGIPTLRDLNREFRQVADDAQSGRGSLLPTGLVRSFTAWSAGPTDPTPELIQLASARLAEGDLEEALARIRQISGAYQPAFAGWMEDAQARLRADALVQRVDRDLAKLVKDLPR